ncbi:MAG: hypothetical protein SGJ18_05975 [Pseudomonadota bacterium]|nr:hypothetical protein [Pseudomonadota bacterium]
MNKKNTIVLFTLFSLFSILSFQNCGGVWSGSGSSRGTSTGNPSLHMSFGSYAESPVQKLSAVARTSELDGVSVIFCFAGLKFKTIQDYEETGDNDSDSQIVKPISFRAQEVSISPLGTDLGFIEVPAETYRQIEFLLNGEKCDSQKSVQVVNSFGTFSTQNEIKLKFNGTKSINMTTAELQMLIVPIIQVLSTVSNDAEIKGKLESVNGLIKEE